MKTLTKEHFVKLLTAITEQHEKNRCVMEGLHQAFSSVNPAGLMPDISVIETAAVMVLQAIVDDKMGITSDYIEASLHDRLPLRINIGHRPVVVDTPYDLWDAIKELNSYYE